MNYSKCVKIKGVYAGHFLIIENIRLFSEN